MGFLGRLSGFFNKAGNFFKGAIGKAKDWLMSRGKKIAMGAIPYLQPIAGGIDNYFGEGATRNALGKLGQLAEDRLPQLRQYLPSGMLRGKGYAQILQDTYDRHLGKMYDRNGVEYNASDVNQVADKVPLSIDRGPTGRAIVVTQNDGQGGDASGWSDLPFADGGIEIPDGLGKRSANQAGGMIMMNGGASKRQRI